MSGQSNFQLNAEERRIINLYTSQYNQINLRITQTHNLLAQLYDSLNEIRDNINSIIEPHLRENHNTNANTNANINANTNSNTNANRNRSNGATTNTTNRTVRRPIINQNGNNQIRPTIVYDYSNPINRSLYQITEPTNRPDRTNFANLISTFLSTPVAVRPTEAQIANASKLIKYSEIEDPIASSCAISLEPFNQNDMVRQINHCKHLFLPDQFDEWFSNNVKCPVCRYDIRTGLGTALGPASRNSFSGLTGGISDQSNTNTNTNTNTNANSNSNANANANTNINFLEAEANIDDEQLISSFSQLFEGLLGINPSSNGNGNGTTNSVRYDSANDVLLYEAIIRPNNRS